MVVYFEQYLFKRYLNSSTFISVVMNISWADCPFLAIALYPLIVITETLIINFEDLPLTFVIMAGVTVFILSFKANFFRIGIKPSI